MMSELPPEPPTDAIMWHGENELWPQCTLVYSYFYYLLTVSFEASHLNYLSLYLLISKMGIIVCVVE